MAAQQRGVFVQTVARNRSFYLDDNDVVDHSNTVLSRASQAEVGGMQADVSSLEAVAEQWLLEGKRVQPDALGLGFHREGTSLGSHGIDVAGEGAKRRWLDPGLYIHAFLTFLLAAGYITLYASGHPDLCQLPYGWKVLHTILVLGNGLVVFIPAAIRWTWDSLPPHAPPQVNTMLKPRWTIFQWTTTMMLNLQLLKRLMP